MSALQPATATLSGADLIIHLLQRQGVGIVAGIPGGALLPLYEALGRSIGIRHILARHEQAAGFIAQGMARLTGKAAVCFATSGPGVTNVVTALADAKLDSIPLVCIAGQVPTALIGTDAFQEVPTVDMVRPITKACFFVRNANELWRVIPEAFAIAESGRPGPVLIDVPKDVQLQLADSEPIGTDPPCESSLTHAGQRHGAISAFDAGRHFDLAAQMINSAQRPVLYVGGGIVKARAHAAIRKLAERASLPVTST
jgi:acetolactate synthase-1/2/3 large subunit